jgi:hypothetical protein
LLLYGRDRPPVTGGLRSAAMDARGGDFARESAVRSFGSRGGICLTMPGPMGDRERGTSLTKPPFTRSAWTEGFACCRGPERARTGGLCSQSEGRWCRETPADSGWPVFSGGRTRRYLGDSRCHQTASFGRLAGQGDSAHDSPGGAKRVERPRPSGGPVRGFAKTEGPCSRPPLRRQGAFAHERWAQESGPGQGGTLLTEEGDLAHADATNGLRPMRPLVSPP